MPKARNSSELFHHWAHQSYPSDKVGNVGYIGPVVFSYAEPIGILLGDGRVLLSNQKFSITTSSHQARAQGATHHLPMIYAPVIPGHLSDLTGIHRQNRDWWMREFTQILVELKNHPRRKVSLGVKMLSVVQALNGYSEFFSLDWPAYRVEDLSEMLAAEAEAAAQWMRESEERRRLERLALIEEQRERLAEWRLGVTGRGLIETALRLCRGQIETTHGAAIPVEHAVKVWPLLKRLKDSGKTYKRNGHTIHLGHYAVDSFDGNTLKVGCHDIPWPEIELMAVEIGLDFDVDTSMQASNLGDEVEIPEELK